MRRSVRLALVLLACLTVFGCKDDKKPTNTDPPPPGAALENIWPNADRLAWSYRFVQRTQSVPSGPVRTYASGDSCRAPSMAELQARMADHPFGGSFTVGSGTYRLRFSGQRTTETGVLGQNLTAEIVPDTAGFTSSPGEGAGSSFWSQLWAARPDLRPGLRTCGVAHDEPELPLFLHGGVWARGRDAIVRYGDLDSLPAWTYLKKNLAPGAQFTHQLIPGLADDVYLHGLMLPAKTVDLGGGETVSALGCLYMVDFGASVVTNEEGEELGYYRMFSYGTIYYARDVGPVASDERGLVEAGSVWTPGWRDATMRLTGGGPAN